MSTADAQDARRRERMAALLGQAWAITPAGFEAVLAAADRLASGEVEAVAGTREAVSATAEESAEYSWRLRIREGVGHIRVYGPLVSTSSWLSWYFDCYDVLANEITMALADPRVRALVLTFDSPGGHVNGCQELARIVRAARGTKPIVAFVEGDACSAAYWVASACDEIVTGETSLLGCLGAQVAYLDDSKYFENWGLREIVITSSQTPEKNRPPTDDSGRRVWQQMVDDIADVFLNTVAEYRGTDRATVDAEFGQGAVLVGARAVAAGLADRVGTYETLHAELASGTWRGASREGDADSTAATAAQHEETSMPKLRQHGAGASANGAKTTAAAFETEAEVTIKVTRDVGVTEGDIGTVVDIRDGSFYRVRVGEATYAWLAEDELEAVTAPAGEGEGDGSGEDAGSGDESTATRTTSAYAAALNAVRIEAQKAEAERITGIIALRTKASIDALLELAKDPAMTAERAAHQLLTGVVKGARSTALADLASDEADLTARGNLSSTDVPGAQTPGNPIVAALRATNPSALVGTAQSARSTGGA